MTLNGITRAILALTLCCAGLFGQNVTSSLVGSVVDQKGAPVVNAPVTLALVGTGYVYQGTTDRRGDFSFPVIVAGTYVVTVKAPGYRSEAITDIVVLAQEQRTVGKLTLEPGSVTDSHVAAVNPAETQAAAPAQSYAITSGDIDSLTQKGRDLVGFLHLLPGVVDSATVRNTPDNSGIGNITIVGNSAAINFNIDGVTDLVGSSNQTAQYLPNIDSIQEIRVLESSYQAEYGRNAGPVVTVITKSGTQDLHGSASWNHRNQEFNANSWANNHMLTPSGTATPRDYYRYNVFTYAVGGPVYIPKVANIERKKLFFFLSQERTRQFVPAPTQLTYVPTSAERGGDFSQTFTNVNGNAVSIPVLDPLNANVQFPNNVVPSSRLSPAGELLLSFFPITNFTPTLSNQLYIDNYMETASSQHPRRNDVLRLDGFITSKLSASFRWNNLHDDFNQPFIGAPFMQYYGSAALTANLSQIDNQNPGHGYQGSLTYQATPTLTNVLTLGQSWTRNTYLTTDNYASEATSLESGLPELFPPPTSTNNGLVSATNGYHSLLPTFVFGGNGLPASAYYTRNSATAGAAETLNSLWQVQDDVTKVLGQHTLKAGFYGERNGSLQPAGQNYNGAYNFAANAAFPLMNTNDGYANAVLGDVNSYTQYTGQTTSDLHNFDLEFYLQDTYKVTRRLTLDFGVRFSHQTPPTDHYGTLENFVPADYKKASMSRLYYPSCAGVATCTTASNGLVARDGLAGAITGAGYIGDLVYGSGNPTTGMVSYGNGTAPYTQKSLAYGPRVGFAYDLFGDGKTALRGGFGISYNRIANNSLSGLSGQAPQIFQQTLNQVTFAQISAADNNTVPSLSNITVSPNSPVSWPSSVPNQGVKNASLDIQRTIDKATVVDIGYTVTRSSNQFLSYDINWVPLGGAWPFTPTNLNPTTSGATSADIGSIFERPNFPGYGPIMGAAFLGSSRYNGLNATVKRTITHNLAATAVYTWSHSNGVTAFSPELSNSTSYNYGRLASDRRQNLQVTFTYAIPSVSTKLGFKKLGYVTDNWSVTGILSIQSGAPYDPTCSVTNGQNAPASYTGTPDLTARCNVVGNPLTGTGSNGNGKDYFNPAAFALPALATGPNNSIVGPPVLGNLGGGAGVLTLPTVTNFDATLTKTIAVFSEKSHLKLQVQAYNVFNHTEISGINSAIQFNPTTNQVSNPTGVGFINAALPNRVLEFTAKFVF